MKYLAVLCGAIGIFLLAASPVPPPFAGTDIVQIPKPAPFTTASPIGATFKNTTLSQMLIARVTDSTICSQSSAGTISGGDEDVDSNVQETLLSLACNNGANYVAGFNPKTLQLTQHDITKITKCPGSDGFSRANNLVYYCKPDFGQLTPAGKANGSTVYAITFSYSATDTSCGKAAGQCPDPTSGKWAALYDFAKCPQAPAGNIQSGSTLGIGIDGDIPLTSALSWTGGQNTARYQFAWNKNSGCYTLDTQGNGSNPIEYGPKGVTKVVINPATGQPVKATYFVHDSSTNGKYVSVGNHACVGSDCPAADGPFFWNWSAYTMIPPTSSLPGHSTMTESLYVNEANPGLFARPIGNLNLSTKVGTYQVVTDSHFNGNVHNDVSPVIGATGGIPQAIWTAPYRDEVVGITLDGSGTIYRYSPTWSTGTTDCNFYCQWSIGFVGQQRDIFCFASDMLGQLGTFVQNGKTLNRGDIFCVRLQ